MTSSSTLFPTKAPRPRGGTDAHHVLSQLDALCEELEAGGIFPGHVELMERYGASERTVRWALAELQRQGKVSRRRKAGTVVAAHDGLRDAPLGFVNGTSPPTAVRGNSIIAITRPDHAVFDVAMKLLCGHVENEGLKLACQFVLSGQPDLPLSDEQPAGYIVFTRYFLPFARDLQRSGQRVVLVGAPLVDESFGVPSVYGDHETGGALVVRHLLDLGHERLAFFNFSEVNHASLRMRGSQRALREAERSGKKVTVCPEPSGWSDNPEATRAYFSAPGAPTAIVAWNDHEAAKILAVLRAAEIKVPREVSLVGYDNLREGQLVYPALTTVETALDQQLRSALDLVTRDQPASSHHSLVVLPSLVSRASSGPVAKVIA